MLRARLCLWSIVLALGGFAEASAAAAHVGSAPQQVSTVGASKRRADAPERVTVQWRDVSLKTALEELERLGGLRIMYSSNIVPLSERVSISFTDVPAEEALARLLGSVGLRARQTRTGQYVLVQWPASSSIGESAGELGNRLETVQQGTITGLVTDGATDAPLASVSVQVVGTSIAQLTGEDGRYTLRGVPAGEAEVRVEHIGYRTQNRTLNVVTGETVTADFVLEVSPTSLDELVVTVTGEQRRREVGNVVAAIRADSVLQNAPVMSFGDLIQGRVPGVLSMTTSSNVGQAGGIRIRGLNSFSVPNDPIVVVDGARIEASSGQAFGGGSPTSAATGGVTGRLADLDPDEIETIDVVKGPSAATLYGTDAANGVLVITTKRGRPGRASWTIFTEQGLLEQRLDEWEDHYYAVGSSVATGEPQRCTLLQRAAGSCVLDDLVSFNAQTNPDTRPFKDAHREQYGLQVQGGTTGGTIYFLSGEYESETGTRYMPPADQALLETLRGVNELPEWQIRPNAFRRVNLRANVTTPLGSRANVTVATGFVSNRARQPANNNPFYQVGYRDANDGWVPGRRPAAFFSVRGEDDVRRFIGSLAAAYNPSSWLALRGTVGADLSTNSFGQLVRRGDAPTGNVLETGQRTVSELDISRYSLDLGATATSALSPAVSSKTSVGVQYNRRTQRGVTITGFGLPLGGETIAGATDVTLGGPPSEATLSTAVAGGYIEQQVGFRDRLFLTGALRLDGGSAFGEDFSVAVYPKAGASWIVTDGQVGPRLPGVTSLRLRAAYGASGVQPGPTAALQQIEVISGVDGTEAAPGAQLGAFGNPDIKPERTSEIEAGLDLELWRSRVRLELTAYQRTSEDALVNRVLAASIGGGSRWENLGSVRNQGLELLLGVDVLRSPTVSAGLTLTGALNQNRLLELGDGVIVSSPTEEGWRQEVGYPVQGLWGRTISSFADANGNGIIEADEITLTENHYIGPGFPTREATVSPYVGLLEERLRLGGLFQYRGGSYLENFPSGLSCLPTLGGSCRGINDASASFEEQARAVAFSQFFAAGVLTEPSSYLLLRELSANLTLPVSWAGAVGARAARLALAARNVALLWRRGSATAPENASSSTDRSFVESAAGPPTYWLLRFHLSF